MMSVTLTAYKTDRRYLRYTCYEVAVALTAAVTRVNGIIGKVCDASTANSYDRS